MMESIRVSVHDGTNTSPEDCVTSLGVCLMPLWLESLINVIGYAGFIAIAMYHKPDKDERSDRI
jgi:hypothetical protein